MLTRIVLLLGRTIWTFNAKTWHCDFNGDESTSRGVVQEKLFSILSVRSSGRTVLVFEPEDLGHQVLETPKVKRSVFASLERIRSEHPVVNSDSLGWGIETPEIGAGGAYYTQIHSELAPNLISLSETCQSAGSPLSAAWSAYTAASACSRMGTGSQASHVLILTPGYVAVLGCMGSNRSYRAWSGKMAERDWKAFLGIIGDVDLGPLPSMAAGYSRGTILVIAEGIPDSICPIWNNLITSKRIDAVIGIKEFAAAAISLPIRHSANLIRGFPRHMDIDPYLAATGLGGGVIALALWASILGIPESREEDLIRSQQLLRSLNGQLIELRSNEREMERLWAQLPKDFEAATTSISSASLELDNALPEALMLTSFTIGQDAKFELKALVVGPGFDVEGARQTMVRHGFLINKKDGWSYNSAAGLVSIRGEYRNNNQ